MTAPGWSSGPGGSCVSWRTSAPTSPRSTATSPVMFGSACSARRPAGSFRNCCRRWPATTRRVRVIVSEGSTSALIPGLLTGRFNAAVVHLPVDDPELSLEPMFAEDLVLVAHGDHPLGRPRRADTPRARRPSPPPAPDRIGAAEGARSRCQRRRRTAERTGRDRRRPAARVRWPSTATGPRSFRRPPCAGSGSRDVRVIPVPQLPPRVVALAHPRRPPPSTPSRALFDVLRSVLAAHTDAQPGVRLGTSLSRSRAPADRFGTGRHDLEEPARKCVAPGPSPPLRCQAARDALPDDDDDERRAQCGLHDGSEMAWRASAVAATATMIFIGGHGLAGATDRPPADDSPGSMSMTVAGKGQVVRTPPPPQRLTSSGLRPLERERFDRLHGGGVSRAISCDIDFDNDAAMALIPNGAIDTFAYSPSWNQMCSGHYIRCTRPTRTTSTSVTSTPRSVRVSTPTTPTTRRAVSSAG